MKLQLIKQFFTLVTVVLALTLSNTFASTNDPNDPNDPNDRNFVWVVALTKESQDRYWNPTLYKIGIEEARVVEKKKIAEQGAPVFCYPLPGERIRVVLSEGVAANGTYVADEITIDLTIDKNDMRILGTKSKKGYNHYQKYRNVALLDKNRKLNIDTPKQFVKRKGYVFLGTSKVDPRAFVLKGFLKDKKGLTLEILDSDTLTLFESIPLKVENRDLGGFFGVSWGDATLLANRYLVCLFTGNSSLGKFAPAYVMIVDTESKTVKYVAIGSDPARGIAY